MKKARARSIICTSLLLAAPAWADLPANGCYTRVYDAAHLAAHPAQGVAALSIWLYAEVTTSAEPVAAVVEARMADQGQGASDEVGGMTLAQYAFCDAAEGRCYVECDGGWIELTPVAGGIEVATAHFVVGDMEGCGGMSNLAEAGDRPTHYRLAAAPIATCESLWRQVPLPAPGCYGVDYPEAVTGQGVRALRLWLRAPEEAADQPVFAQIEGVLGVTLPNSGTAAVAGMGGARLSLPLWCQARDGLCRSGVGEGVLALPLTEAGVDLVTDRFFLFGPEESFVDLAQLARPDGRAPATVRHPLRRLPDDACRGLE